MIGFWLAAGAMLAGALFCVARPLMRRVEEGSTPGSRALLVTLYQGELARADAELHAGTLSPELHAVTRRDIEARLLEDVGPAQSRRRRLSDRRRPPPRRAASRLGPARPRS